MPLITGTISGSIQSISYDVPSRCTWFSVFNRTGGAGTVNLGVVVSGRDIYFKSISLAANASSDEKVDIKLLAGTKILIVSSVSIDYVFTIDGGDN
jgi:hypothetical protein